VKSEEQRKETAAIEFPADAFHMVTQVTGDFFLYTTGSLDYLDSSIFSIEKSYKKVLAQYHEKYTKIYQRQLHMANVTV
jgi:hypothetical protein